MATEPRYIYDPVTQTYTRVDTPMAEAAPLYNLSNSGNEGSVATASRGPGFNQGVSPFAQQLGLGLLSYGNFLGGFAPGGTMANIAGGAITEHQAGAIGDAISNIADADKGPGRSMGIATAMDMAGNTGTISNQSTVNKADLDTFGITGAGLAGLSAMNAQQAQENQAQAQAAQTAGVAEAVGSAVSEEADAAQDAANAADAAAAASTSNGSDGTSGNGGGGGGTTDGGPGGPSGAGDESSHDADGNNSGSDDSYYRGGRVMKYAQGGVADAYKTQARGRGNDTMLVHMTPGEVQGLQALAMKHGGSLTINPQTGLPEAGFLSSILPMVAGAALMATPIGAALGAAGTAGLVGLGSYAMNPKQGLMGGIMAGLGAYGGANLMGGLAGAESIGAQNAGIQAANDEIAKQAANLNADTVFNEEAIRQAQSGAAQKFAEGSVWDQLGQSAKDIGNQPISSTVAQFGGPYKVASAVMPLASAAGVFDEGEAPDVKTPETRIRPFSFDYKPSDKTNPDFKYRTGARGESTAEQRYFTPTFTPIGVFKPGEEPAYGSYAAGGIAGLKKGRFLSGRGDGMSDDIPATIEDKQPARLADGEFVVPADVVSHIGNGSSKAGAKKLYAMMDRVRHARTGRKQQAPEVNANKYMPA